MYRDLSVGLRDRITRLKAGIVDRRLQGLAGDDKAHERALQTVLEIEAILGSEAEPGPAGRLDSTSTRRAPRSLRGLLSGLPTGELDGFLDAFSPNALVSLPWLFEHWALGAPAAPRRETGRPGSSWAAGGRARRAPARNGSARRSKAAGRATRGCAPGSPWSARRSTRRAR